MTKTKLSSTQESLLKTAAGCEDRAIRWPASLKGGARKKVLDSLLGAGLVAAKNGVVVITDDGMRAVGVEPATVAPHGSGLRPARGQAPAATGRKSKTPRAKVAKEPKARPTRDPGAPRKTRADSKQARLIEMLKRAKGATIAEIIEAFGWQPHTVRGAIAGALKKKLGLAVTSEKVEGRGRTYRIPG